MKYLTFPILCLLILAGCQAPAPEAEGLEGKKAMLKEKKTALAALKTEIKQLEAEIQDLDTVEVEKPRRLVTTQKVLRKDFKRYVEIQANVESDDIVMASSETGGRILNVNFKEGQSIRKGQLVAKLDLESINKQIAELETSKELAVDVYERQKRLWDQNIGSEMQYLKAKNDVERIDKSLETLSHQLTKANVYSPISGVVDMVFLKGGEISAPGTPILQILNTSKVKVVADVPENYLGKVRRGEQVSVKFPALDKEINARVSLIGRTIDPSNRTFAVEVTVPNGKGTLKPNLLAMMLINDYSQDDVVTIPLEMVQQEVGGNNYVYLAGQSSEGQVAQKAYVETGESFDGEIIITSGLKGGEELIMEGARGLANNELIEIKAPAAATADNANG